MLISYSSAISPAISLRASGVRVFFDDLTEDFVVQGEVRVHLLELGVFFFEFLQLFKLTDLETAVLPFPLIERGSGNVESSADFVGRYPGFKFVYAFNYFRFGMSQFFQGCSFATKGSILTMA